MPLPSSGRMCTSRPQKEPVKSSSYANSWTRTRSSVPRHLHTTSHFRPQKHSRSGSCSLCPRHKGSHIPFSDTAAGGVHFRDAKETNKSRNYWTERGRAASVAIRTPLTARVGQFGRSKGLSKLQTVFMKRLTITFVTFVLVCVPASSVFSQGRVYFTNYPDYYHDGIDRYVYADRIGGTLFNNPSAWAGLFESVGNTYVQIGSLQSFDFGGGNTIPGVWSWVDLFDLSVPALVWTTLQVRILTRVRHYWEHRLHSRTWTKPRESWAL